MPGKLLFVMGLYRVVKNEGSPRYVVETLDGTDALGVMRWEPYMELGGDSRMGEVDKFVLALIQRIEGLEAAQEAAKVPAVATIDWAE